MNFNKFDKAYIIAVLIGSAIGTFITDGIKSNVLACLTCLVYIGYILFDKLCDIEKKIDNINKD